MASCRSTAPRIGAGHQGCISTHSELCHHDTRSSTIVIAETCRRAMRANIATAARTFTLLPCDPSDCRQYFNVQLQSLGLAVVLARALNRSLVLPPFLLVENQGLTSGYEPAQQVGSPVRFGHFFNVSRLRDAAAREHGLEVLEWHELLEPSSDPEPGVLELSRVLLHARQREAREQGCAAAAAQSLHLATSGAVRSLRPARHLLGVPLRVPTAQCGDARVGALAEWVHRARPFFHSR